MMIIENCRKFEIKYFSKKIKHVFDRSVVIIYYIFISTCIFIKLHKRGEMFIVSPWESMVTSYGQVCQTQVLKLRVFCRNSRFYQEIFIYKSEEK